MLMRTPPRVLIQHFLLSDNHVMCVLCEAWVWFITITINLGAD